MGKLGGGRNDPSDAVGKRRRDRKDPSDAVGKLGSGRNDPSDAVGKRGSGRNDPSDAVGKRRGGPKPSGSVTQVFDGTAKEAPHAPPSCNAPQWYWPIAIAKFE